jgi:serine protease Do
MNEAFKNDFNAENDFNSNEADNLSEAIAYVETNGNRENATTGVTNETDLIQSETVYSSDMTRASAPAPAPQSEVTYAANEEAVQRVHADMNTARIDNGFSSGNRSEENSFSNGNSNGSGSGNVTPPKKHRSFNFKTVLSFVLILTLIGGSTYSIGYYKGQISLNESAIETSVQQILSKNIDSEIYRSVVNYMDDNGTDVSSATADVAQIYANVGNSVVGITSKLKYYDWFNNERYTEGAGSGVIIKEESDKYYIVTNYHVVDGATEVLVEIATDQMIDSKLIGYDQDADIAVLSINKADIPVELADNIRAISIGDSSMLLVGEPAIAIGNPLGYNNTVTAGVVSALDRKVGDDSNTTYIQTDAAINPGNSGGALVNKKGELIGINTAKITDTTVEGMGFAIPVNIFMPIVAEIIENGYVAKPYIGIGGVDISQEASDLYEVPVGVLVRYIYENSPAADSTLKEMDVIIAFDGEKVNTMDELTSFINAHEPGDKVTLTVVRDNKEKISVNITLGDKNKTE